MSMSRRSPSTSSGIIPSGSTGSSVLGPRAPTVKRRAPNLYIANPDSDEEDERNSTGKSTSPPVGRGKPPLRVVTQPPTPGYTSEPSHFRTNSDQPLPDLGAGISPLSQAPHPTHYHPQPPHLPPRSSWSPTEQPPIAESGPSALAYTHSSHSFKGNSSGDISKPVLSRRADTSPISALSSTSGASLNHPSLPLPAFSSRDQGGGGMLPPGAEPPRAGSVPNGLAARIKQERAFTTDRSSLPRISTPPTVPLPPPPPPTGGLPPIPQHYPSRPGNHSANPSTSGHSGMSASGSPSSPSSRQQPFSHNPSTTASTPPHTHSVPSSRSASQPSFASHPAPRLHALPALPSFSAAHGTKSQGGSPGRSVLGNVRLAVTTDGESFSVVDVSGVESAEAIVERVFAKLRFRDDDHPNLSMYRTDIGEQPDSNPIAMPALFELCHKEGDPKGGLKFLVLQNAMPLTPSSSIVPPPIPQAAVAAQETLFYMSSPAEDSRGTFSQSSQSNAGQVHDHGMVPRESDGRHSHQGSFSSASDLWGKAEHVLPSPGGVGGTAEDGNVDASPTDPHPYSGQAQMWRDKDATNSLMRSTRLASQRRRLPSSSTSRSSRSPVDNRYTANRPFASPLEASAQSSATSISMAPSGSSKLKGLAGEGPGGEATPTYAPYQSGTNATGPASYSTGSKGESPQRDNPIPSSSSKRPQGVHGQEYRPQDYRWQKSPSEPTEADLAIIAKLEREEEERDRQKRIQLEDDARVAMMEQEKEKAAYQMRTMQETHARQRQVEADRRAAEQALQQEREQAAAAVLEREHESKQRRDAERAEREREKQVGRERRERRAQWEQRQQLARMNGDGTLASITPVWPTYGSGDAGLAGVGAGRGTLEPLFVTTGMKDTSDARSALGPSPKPYSDIGTSHESLFRPPGRSVVPPGSMPPPPRRNMDRSRAERPGQRQGIYASEIGPAYVPEHPQGSGQSFAQPDSVLRWQQGVAAGDPNALSPTSGGPDYGKRSLQSTRSMDDMRPQYPGDDYLPSLGGVPPYRPSPESSRSFARVQASGFAGAYETSAMEEIYQDDGREGGSNSRPHRSDESRRDNQNHFGNRDLVVPRLITPTVDFPTPVPYNGDRRGSESHASSSPAAYTGSRRASLGVLYSPQLGGESRPRTPERQLSGGGLEPPGLDSDQRSISQRSAHTLRGSPKTKGNGDAEDNSGDTARAGEWAKELNNLMQSADGGTLIPAKASTPEAELEDQAEETLWFVPPSTDQGGDGTFVPPKPQLQVDTRSRSPAESPEVTSAEASDGPLSVTDSEADEQSSNLARRVKRNKSFAKTRDQWNFRPPAEHVYDNLEEFFPKIDLDKPVVEADTVIDATSPRTDSPPTYPHMMPDIEEPEPKSRSRFNKAEARKSIRVVAEGRKKHLSKIAPAVKPQLAVTSLERKRSSSMWGHKVVEVTPAKIKNGQVGATGESIDSGPVTMTWVKGDLIGKGTYGRVYLALNATTGDMIAVKQVEMPRTESDREDARQSGMIDALKSEIALLKDLDHPNVVSYLGWEESPKYLSIFLEYVPGGSVASVYRKHRKFEEAVIKSFTKQILEGLAYLHSLHILHRDLKADNILVDPSGVCKISDFGISKRADDAYGSMVSTNLKGSVFWMAPEVVHSVKGQGYSAKVDIWSLGCCVLEMWAGRRPWGDMEALAAMFQLANARSAPPVPEDVTLSATADDFLNKKCFASNPRDRPTAVELLLHAFITDVDPHWTFAESGIGRAVVAGMKKR